MHNLILIVGVAFVGAMLGYMVGGSATPVVGIAIPAIFGLVVTGVGLMQTTQLNKDIIEAVKNYGEQANSSPDIQVLRDNARRAPSRVGLTLIAFSICYLCGATIGAKARIESWLLPTPTA